MIYAMSEETTNGPECGLYSINLRNKMGQTFLKEFQEYMMKSKTEYSKWLNGMIVLYSKK